MDDFERIAEGCGMRIGRAAGRLVFASAKTGGRFIPVDPIVFPALSGPDAETEALKLHLAMIAGGIPESIVEEFIRDAGFNVLD